MDQLVLIIVYSVAILWGAMFFIIVFGSKRYFGIIAISGFALGLTIGVCINGIPSGLLSGILIGLLMAIPSPK